jgi:apolipoprotein N-acyltransferase
MIRPIRTSLIASLIFGPAAVLTGRDGYVGATVTVLAVFFAIHFALLLTHRLYNNRVWRVSASAWLAAEALRRPLAAFEEPLARHDDHLAA